MFQGFSKIGYTPVSAAPSSHRVYGQLKGRYLGQSVLLRDSPDNQRGWWFDL